MDFVYGKCKFNYLQKKVEPESGGFEKVIVHITKQTSVREATEKVVLN